MHILARAPKRHIHSKHTGRKNPIHFSGNITRIQRAAIRDILNGFPIQTKLGVGQAGDKYEQEADRVADRVVLMPDTEIKRQEVQDEEDQDLQLKQTDDQSGLAVQRMCEECEEDVQRQASDESEQEEEQIQSKQSAAGTATVSSEIESGIQSLKGNGEPLSESSRTYFEPRFGKDFSNVRVHTDTRANQLARSISAKAFTLGNDVVFGAGEYQPQSTEGKRLMAHELTHVIQQNKTSNQKLRESSIQSKDLVSLKGTASIQRKLDRTMVQYANETLWKNHPELKRRQLTKSKADAELRKEWWRYYRWGEKALSKGNCYRYAVNDPATKGQAHSPFPGGKDPGGHITCDQVMNGAKKFGAVDATRDKPCAKGLRKIAGVIQDKSAPKWNDYHWYRQESNGIWSHKRGTNPVEYKDAAGNVIKDPAAADRNYPGNPDYDKFCGYLCVSQSIDVDRVP